MIENMREEGKCKIIIIINTFWYIDQDHTTIKVIMEVITIIEVKEVTHHLKEEILTKEIILMCNKKDPFKKNQKYKCLMILTKTDLNMKIIILIREEECHHLIFNLIFSLEIKNSKADFQIIEMGSKNILLLQQII